MRRWDGREVYTIGYGMGSEWAGSGRRDGRNGANVGREMRSEWADSAAWEESGTGALYFAAER